MFSVWKYVAAFYILWSFVINNWWWFVAWDTRPSWSSIPLEKWTNTRLKWSNWVFFIADPRSARFAGPAAMFQSTAKLVLAGFSSRHMVKKQRGAVLLSFPFGSFPPNLVQRTGVESLISKFPEKYGKSPSGQVSWGHTILLSHTHTMLFQIVQRRVEGSHTSTPNRSEWARGGEERESPPHYVLDP